MKPWLVAHRGAPCKAPENTLKSFEIASQYPVAYIELDIHVTADNIAIINHDAKIGGLTIKKTNFADLLDAKPDLATFDQLANSSLNKNLMIELKSDGSAPFVLDFLKNNPGSVVTGYKLNEILYLKDQGIDPSRLFHAHHYLPFGLKKTIEKHNLGGISFDYRFFWLFLGPTSRNRMAYTVNHKFTVGIIRKFIPDCMICTNNLYKFGETTTNE